jgi:hypothetical protein
MLISSAARADLARGFHCGQQRGDGVFLCIEPVLAQADARERGRRAGTVAAGAIHPCRFEQELERPDEIGHVEVTAAERVQGARDERGVLEALRDRTRLFREWQRALGLTGARKLRGERVERARPRLRRVAPVSAASSEGRGGDSMVAGRDRSRGGAIARGFPPRDRRAASARRVAA